MTMPLREDRCERCRHWQRLEDDVLDIGVCRRYPPTLDNGTDCNAAWPETLATDYCGEWVPLDTGLPEPEPDV